MESNSFYNFILPSDLQKLVVAVFQPRKIFTSFYSFSTFFQRRSVFETLGTSFSFFFLLNIIQQLWVGNFTCQLSRLYQANTESLSRRENSCCFGLWIYTCFQDLTYYLSQGLLICSQNSACSYRQTCPSGLYLPMAKSLNLDGAYAMVGLLLSGSVNAQGCI